MSPLVEAVAGALDASSAMPVGVDTDELAQVAVRAVIDFVTDPTLHQRLYALLNADA